MSKPDEGPSAPKQQELDFHHSVFTNLQPPPMAPDLVMEEPVDMEVADSPPPSVYTRPFNVSDKTNQFYLFNSRRLFRQRCR
jgi:hypothetical protein